MITSDKAANIARGWQELELEFGVRTIEFLRNVVAPAIEQSARQGQRSTVISNLNTDLLNKIVASLLSLGYAAQAVTSNVHIEW